MLNTSLVRYLARPIATALLLATTSLAAHAQSGGCLLTPDALAKTFGGKFSPGKDEGNQGMMGHGCSYASDRHYTVWLITLKPAEFGMSGQQILKMTEPGQWKPLDGDTDGALYSVQKPDVPPFPSIAYERKGLLVKLRIVGSGAGQDTKAITDMNARLAKLPRLP